MSVIGRQHKSVIPSVARDLHFSRRIAALSATLLVLALATVAQEPKEVPVAQEPSHHKVFENSYVRVFRVTIPANQSSLLHRHDLDYMYVSLGPADVINAVVGKPEIHPKLIDGQVGFAKGGFAHVATAVGIPFNNVTIELLRPQGEPHNLCVKVVEGPLGNCQLHSMHNDTKASPVFETAEMRLDRVEIGSRAFTLQLWRKFPRLLVALEGMALEVETGGQSQLLHSGDVAWLPGGIRSRISTAPGVVLGSRYLLLNFEEKGTGAKSGKP